MRIGRQCWKSPRGRWPHSRPRKRRPSEQNQVSGDLQSLQHRIDGAADLEGVVRSMKALAASSIGQYEKAVASLDDYYRTVELALAVCLRQADPPLAEKSRRHAVAIGAIVFGSDQGLVGRFNEVV